MSRTVRPRRMPATKPDAAAASRAKLAKGTPVLGTGPDGKPMPIDLERLVATRMLIQAASGGGKSWALRRLIEQTHGRLQQIVIDPEGELTTLAEKLDFVVLSGDSSEFPLNWARGADVADLLFHSGRSAVLCLAEFDVEDMQVFVRDFLRSLMRQSRETWHPVLVAIDEAQLFAPQHDKSESKKAMIDLAARGRKRGICPVVATQRLSQLHKGVVANLDNKAIGLTTLDVDVERAADQLGMRQAQAKLVLRALHAGEFLVYGPALTYDITKIVVGPVTTRHGGVSLAATGPYRPSMSVRDLAKHLEAMAEPGGEVEDAATVVPVKCELGQAGAKTADACPAVRAGRNWTAPPGMPAHMVEATCLRMAHARLGAIAPLMAYSRIPAGNLQQRADALGLQPHDLRNWLARHDDDKGVDSLRPSRLMPHMLAQLPALENALQRLSKGSDETPARQGPAKSAPAPEPVGRRYKARRTTASSQSTTTVPTTLPAVVPALVMARRPGRGAATPQPRDRSTRRQA